MFKEIDRKKWIVFVLFVCFLIEALLEFKVHRRFVFMRDDLWYTTNLVTGEPLAGIADVIESQLWHFQNWGGRNINHGLLQLVLMGGELFADILNMIVTCTLSFLICETAGKRNVKYFCLSFFLLISLNTDIKQSMFWQSGAANYLYSTNWVLLFIFLYLRQVRNPDAKQPWGITLWMIPLGLITGWSNENMGPASFAFCVMVLVYFGKLLKKKVPVWMWLGAVSSLCGSVMVIVAPGNFVRSTTVEEMPLWESIYNRFWSMFVAETSYLFPATVCMLLFLLVYMYVGNKLQPFQIMLMLTAVLAYGAMILSPTFPARATFGIMVICIVLIISFIHGLEEKYISLFAICEWLYGMYALMVALKLPM